MTGDYLSKAWTVTINIGFNEPVDANEVTTRLRYCIPRTLLEDNDVAWCESVAKPELPTSWPGTNHLWKDDE